MSDERLKRIEDRLERLDENVSDIAVIMARNTASLELHMKRSDALEEYVKQVEERDLEPIKRHVNQVTWAVKGIFWIIGVAAATAIFIKQLGVF
jgi:hypothetical protein